uniref:Uncharacterized protein n=1 Tax=Rhizophora mucronata TaxID=61149 RepID=A0A2P2NTP5_RHIMU
MFDSFLGLTHRLIVFLTTIYTRIFISQGLQLLS